MIAAILIEIDEEHLVKETNELYDRLKGYKCELRPLPQKKHLDESLDSENFKLEYARFDGWNACLDEILGDADKESLDDMDIIRKWERYCACGEKMIPTATGGWYCPVCHRTMKSILFKRVTGDKL